MQKRSSHVISFCKNLFIPKFPLKTVAPEASRENSLLTSTNHYFYAQQYMMLTRDRIFHSVSQRNKVKTRPANDQLNDQEKIQKKQRQQ